MSLLLIHGRRIDGLGNLDGRLLFYPDESTSLARETSIWRCYSETAYDVWGPAKANEKENDEAYTARAVERNLCSKRRVQISLPRPQLLYKSSISTKLFLFLAKHVLS